MIITMLYTIFFHKFHTLISTKSSQPYKHSKSQASTFFCISVTWLYVQDQNQNKPRTEQNDNPTPSLDKNPSAGCPIEGQRKEKKTYFTSINLSNRRSAIRTWKRPPLHSSSSIGCSDSEYCSRSCSSSFYKRGRKKRSKNKRKMLERNIPDDAREIHSNVCR